MSRLQVTDCIEEHSCIITHLKFMSTACSEVWASGSITDPFRYPPDDVAWLRTWQGLRGFKHREIIKPESYRIFTYQFTLRDIEIIYIRCVQADSLSLSLWHIFTNADSHSELDLGDLDHIGLPLKSRQSAFPQNKFRQRKQLPHCVSWCHTKAQHLTCIINMLWTVSWFVWWQHAA